MASLLTREKERLAEEVHELRRRHASMEERLKLANAESARAATELRRRDRTIATLESAEGDGRRVARIAELEAENDAYASEVTRLAAILRFARDDDDNDAATASNESSRAEARLRAQLALGPTMGKGHADGVEDELVEAKRRAETLAARVERLERDEASARRRAEAFERETKDVRAERDALRAEVRRLEEDNDHLRRLAAMEAAAASSARDDARLAEAECARTKPALASLRRQLAAVGERLARERGGTNAEEAIDTILAATERPPEGGERRAASAARDVASEVLAERIDAEEVQTRANASRERSERRPEGGERPAASAARDVASEVLAERIDAEEVQTRANASREQSERRPEGGGRPVASAARDVASSDPPTAEGDENASDSADEELFDDLDESWATDAAAEDRAPEDEDEDPIGEARR